MHVRAAAFGLPSETLRAVVGLVVHRSCRWTPAVGGLTTASHGGAARVLATGRGLARGVGGVLAAQRTPGVGSTVTRALLRARAARGTLGNPGRRE